MNIPSLSNYCQAVKEFYYEQSSYLEELLILNCKIKPILENPKSGIDGDTIDIIFGNLEDIITISTRLRNYINDTIVFSPDFFSVAPILLHFAEAGYFDVYVYYSNRYQWSHMKVDILNQNTELLKYTFVDCVRLGLTEDSLICLLRVLLFKPIQNMEKILNFMHETETTLLELSKACPQEFKHLVHLELEMIQEAADKTRTLKFHIMDTVSRFQDIYRYDNLYLIPRKPADQNSLSSNSKKYLSNYVYMIVEKKPELVILTITDFDMSVKYLDPNSKDVITRKESYRLSHILAVKDFRNDLNQFSCTVNDQTMEFLANFSDNKDDIITTLSLLISKRIFLKSSDTLERMCSLKVERNYENLPMKGDLDTLLEKVIHYDVTEDSIRKFFTVYKLFVSSRELLNKLLEFYNSTARDTARDTDVEDTKSRKLHVLRTLRFWLMYNCSEFITDGLLCSTLNIFLDSCKREKWLSFWVKLVEKHIQHLHSEDERDDEFLWFMTQDYTKFSLLSLHPHELAKQITLIEFDMLNRIPISELLACSGDVIQELRVFQERYMSWMRRSVVDSKNIFERTATIRCLLEILRKMYDLNNFSGLFVIYNTIYSAEICRLRHSFSQVLQNYQDLISEVQKLMINNYEEYWTVLKTIKPPYIPIMDLFADHISESVKNEAYVSDNIIDLEQCFRMYDTMGCQVNLALSCYPFAVEPNIKDCLMKLKPLEGKSREEFVMEQYNKSLLIEPQGQPPAYFPRSTSFNLDIDPGQFFSWKSTSVKVSKSTSNLVYKEAENHNVQNSIDSFSKTNRGRTLTKSKSFSSKTSNYPPPPLPPRSDLINKQNNLSRSHSFENKHKKSLYEQSIIWCDRKFPYHYEAEPHFGSGISRIPVYKTIHQKPTRQPPQTPSPGLNNRIHPIEYLPPKLPMKTRQSMTRPKHGPIANEYDEPSECYDLNVPPPVPPKTAPPRPPRQVTFR